MWNEAERHELHQRLSDLLGPDAAGALMRQLPPYEWTEMATARDLEAVELRLEAKFERGLRETENNLRDEIHTQTRFLFYSTVGAVLTTAALSFSAFSLAL